MSRDHESVGDAYRDFFELLKSRHVIRYPPVPGVYSFVNPYSYQVLADRSDLHPTLHFIGVDGGLLVRVLRFAGLSVHRQSFDATSLALPVLNAAVEASWRVALIGSEEGVAGRAAVLLEAAVPNLRVWRTYSGYFEGPQSREHVLNELARENVELVVCGMGAGLQEEFLHDLWSRGWRGRGFTCGAFLEQIAMGSVEYYPPWVDRFGIRWLYRICHEPKVFARYVRHYPVFCVRFARHVICRIRMRADG